jgi:hypothetical protein
MTLTIKDLKTFIELSEHTKFAIRASLSLMLAFIIPIMLNWDQVTTAPITVLIIAANERLHSTVMIGIYRIIGTVFGATIGILLISIFPQDRLIYLSITSILVFLFFYIYNAYKGDKTVIYLTIMIILLVFHGGGTDDIFLYGINRAYMTIFGVTVYTLVNIFILPVKSKGNLIETFQSLNKIHIDFFNKILSKNKNLEEITELQNSMISKNNILQNTEITSKTIINNELLTPEKSKALVFYNNQITEILNNLSELIKENKNINYLEFINNKDFLDQINSIMNKCQNSLTEKNNIEFNQDLKITRDDLTYKNLKYIEVAKLVAFTNELNNLYQNLIKLADLLNYLNGYESIYTHNIKKPKKPKFIWLDPDNFIAATQYFLVYSVGMLFWIYFNNPLGYTSAALAAILGIIPIRTPIKPISMLIIFSLGFIMAALSYIFILPNLHYSWQLAIFIFAYSFIGFYIFKSKLRILYILSIFDLMISNHMNYNFATFLTILLMYYVFIALLMMFYNFPFSAKPEFQFKTKTKRIYSHIDALLNLLSKPKLTNSENKLLDYHFTHIQVLLMKIKVWSSKIDFKYFDKNSKESVVLFVKSTENLINKLNTLYKHEKLNKNNELTTKIKKHFLSNNLAYISKLCLNDATAPRNIEKETYEYDNFIKSIEDNLNKLADNIKKEVLSDTTLANAFLNLSLRHSVWNAMNACINTMNKINFNDFMKTRL